MWHKVVCLATHAKIKSEYALEYKSEFSEIHVNSITKQIKESSYHEDLNLLLNEGPCNKLSQTKIFVS